MEPSAPQDAAESARPSRLGAAVRNVIHNPVQLRVALMAALFGAWYTAFGMPISERIDDTLRRTERGRKRVGAAKEVERLRAQVARFEGRLPKKSDPNEWVQFMLDGVRKFPLRLALLDTDGTREVGPYKAIVIKLQFEGGFHDADAFLRWVEGNERLLRVDALHAEPSRSSPMKLDVSLVVLGVMG